MPGRAYALKKGVAPMAVSAPTIPSTDAAIRRLDDLLDLSNVRMKLADPDEGGGLPPARLDLLEQEYRTVPRTAPSLPGHGRSAVQDRRRDVARPHPRYRGLSRGLRRRSLAFSWITSRILGCVASRMPKTLRMRTSSRWSAIEPRSASHRSIHGSRSTQVRVASALRASRRNAGKRPRVRCLQISSRSSCPRTRRRASWMR